MAVTGCGEPLILDGAYTVFRTATFALEGVFRRATFALEGALLDLERAPLDLERAPLARGGAIDLDVAADAERSERRCRGATKHK